MISRSGHRTASRRRAAGRSDGIQGLDRRAPARVRARIAAVAGVLAVFAIGAAVAMASRTASRTKARGGSPFVACIVILPPLPDINRDLKLRTSNCRSYEQRIAWPPQGSRGPAGLRGPAGPAGPRGPEGPKGVTGSQEATPAAVNTAGDQFATSGEARSTCPPGTALLGGGAVASPGSAIEESQASGNDSWSAMAVRVQPGNGPIGVIVTAVCTK
jgi:hypothetical protein